MDRANTVSNARLSPSNKHSAAMPGCLSLRRLLKRGRSHQSTSLSQTPTQHNVDGLCKFCADLSLDVQDFRGSRNATLAEHRASFQKIILPPFSIIQSQGCSFCRTLMSAVVDSDAGRPTLTSVDEVEYGLEWIKDGRKLQENDVVSPSTRRLRIFASDGTLTDTFLVLVAPTGSNERFLGRKVDPSSIDLQRVRRWLSDCRDGHESCHEDLETSTKRLYQNPSFRLIDVERGCIVPGNNEPFLALSYVWGGSLACKLQKYNFTDFMKPGRLTSTSEDLPCTIKDAMHLTALLKYRYI